MDRYQGNLTLIPKIESHSGNNSMKFHNICSFYRYLGVLSRFPKVKLRSRDNLKNLINWSLCHQSQNQSHFLVYILILLISLNQHVAHTVIQKGYLT